MLPPALPPPFSCPVLPSAHFSAIACWGIFRGIKRVMQAPPPWHCLLSGCCKRALQHVCNTQTMAGLRHHRWSPLGWGFKWQEETASPRTGTSTRFHTMHVQLQADVGEPSSKERPSHMLGGIQKKGTECHHSGLSNLGPRRVATHISKSAPQNVLEKLALHFTANPVEDTRANFVKRRHAETFSHAKAIQKSTVVQSERDSETYRKQNKGTEFDSVVRKE